jgi:outer membrane biogenesis lipoprotein LolB
MIRRLLPVLALALLAACADVTGPQDSALSSSVIDQQDSQQTTQGAHQGAQGTGVDTKQKPSTGLQ